MRIIQFFKIFFRLMKDAPKIAEQLEAQRAQYIEMTPEELASLPDEELFSAALARTEAAVDYEELTDSFAGLSGHQKVLFAVNYLETEVNNGGLCQFFVNSSRAVAPYISEYLGIIGAEAHKALFDGFISKNQIDLNDLSSFEIRRIKDFEKQTKRYPFDEYDDAFYELESLEIPLTAYVRKHLDAF